MEINKAFQIITKKVEDVLVPKGYTKQDVAQSDNEITALYTGDNAYSVVYYTEKMRVVLRTCGMNEDEPDNAWKTIATWLFDPDADSDREAENIGEDFAETIRGPKLVRSKRKTAKTEKITPTRFFSPTEWHRIFRNSVMILLLKKHTILLSEA